MWYNDYVVEAIITISILEEMAENAKIWAITLGVTGRQTLPEYSFSRGRNMNMNLEVSNLMKQHHTRLISKWGRCIMKSRDT